MYVYKYPTKEAFRYHFRPLKPISWETEPQVPDKQKDFGAYLGYLTDRPSSEHWYQDKRGAMSERAELDYRMAPDITRKDAPFGTTDTPTITMKIIGGRQIPVIEKHPVGVDSYGSRIQPLQPITEKPNHLDPRTYGDNPAGYYNTVQDFFGEGDGSFYDEPQESPRPTTLISKRPDSKDISRVHYKALPPIQANRTRNDMSTVFEKETWTANRDPPLAKETEYKTNYFSDSPYNDMDQRRYSSQRRDHLGVEPEEYEQLTKIMPPNVFLPNDPVNYSRLEPVLTRLIAGEMEGGNPQELKDVYLEASQHDKDLRGFCSLEVLDNCLHRHKFHIPDLRLVAAQYVDPAQPGKVNYEKTLSFLERASKLKDGGDMSDKPKYYMSNGETIKLGYYYKDGEVAKLLRTVENELSKSSYFMDWTKWNNAFNKMDRDHRETLSASQIKDICYDNKLPLSDSIVNQILALCEDNNRDGQYRWSDFLEFLSRVRPSNTGLPIPVSKRPLDYAKRIPEPVPNWPRTDANTSPERHSPRKESPYREPSPDKRGYADRTASPSKATVQVRDSKTPDGQEQVKSPVKQIIPVEKQEIVKKPEPSNRVRHEVGVYSPSQEAVAYPGFTSTSNEAISQYEEKYKYLMERYSPERQNLSPSRHFEHYFTSPVPPVPHVLPKNVDDQRSRYFRAYGQYRQIFNERESHSPDRHWSNDQNDNQHLYHNGNDTYNRGNYRDRSYKNDQSRYIPSWHEHSRWKSPTPGPPRNMYQRQYPDEMRYLNRDSYDNYMNTWAEQQMRGQWPDSRFNRPKSYAEPQRYQAGPKQENTGRVRPLSYKENLSGGYDMSYQPGGMRTPVRRNRSLSPVLQPSPDRGMQYPETARNTYRVPNPDIYREAYSQNYSSPYRDNQQYSQYHTNQQPSFQQSRFDGPPGGYSGRGDYGGYDRRDGYGYDDYQGPGQYRYDGHQKTDREYQIKQLTHELRDLESKYHMTREAMKSHEKPWPDRYLKLAEALYNSDVSNKGYLHKEQVMAIVKECNDIYRLGLDLTYAESLITMREGNIDRYGNVLLRPFITNLSGAWKNSVTNVVKNSH